MSAPPHVPRHDARALARFAHALFARAGMRDDMARDVADVLVDGDLLGHTTHGLALAAPYLAELEKGSMRRPASRRSSTRRPAAQTWDGGRLPGPWLTLRALDAAMAMASTQGTGTVVIRRSHHIACLAAYLKRATDRGHDGDRASAPTRSRRASRRSARVSPVFTPNPLAAGIPTSGDPILLDVSASYTTNGLTGAPAQGRAEAAARVDAGRAGQRRRPIRACCSTSRRARCCRSAASTRATRATRSRS